MGGYRLHIHCRNAKNGDTSLPTVIISAGAGTPSTTYHWLLEGIAETTRACIYDRAGIAWSEESDLPRDSKTIAMVLQKLLDAASIKRPFVFVGHSIAGPYMRQYFDLYPDDVAGLVFLDASHPEQVAAFGLESGIMTKQAETTKAQMLAMQILVSLGITEIYNPITALSPHFKA